MSKVMLAFLGTSDYLECNYELAGYGKVSRVRFVEEALSHLVCKEWSEKDRIVIFLTEEAKNKNWLDNGHKDRDGKTLQRKGLRSRLESLNLKTKICTKDVPEGRTEEELWKIFEVVCEEIKERDEIVFDITHGFRSLPMLVIVILNYVRVLKQAKIGGIYYGAFETLGPPNRVREMDIDKRNVPVFDLTSFAHLYRWSDAINNFLTYGDAREIKELTAQRAIPILKKTRGQNESAKNLREMGKQLEILTRSIQTSRGLKIIRDFGFRRLKELITLNKKSTLKPLNHLLDKISYKIEKFDDSAVKNGYLAVEWCIQHNLIQQGYTLLQETMITELVAEHFRKDKISCKRIRNLVSQAITIRNRNLHEHEDKWEKPAKNNKKKVKEIIKGLSDDIRKVFESVSQNRNDINHGGFVDKPNYRTPDELESNLKKNWEKIWEKISKEELVHER